MSNSFIIEKLFVAMKPFLAFVVAIAFIWWKKNSRTKLPDGPFGLPILGYLPFLGRSPPKTLARLSKTYGRIFSIKLGSKNCVMLTKYEDIYEAFCKRSASFSGRDASQLMRDVGGDTGVVFRSYSETWKSLRKFTITTLKGFGVGKRSMEDRVNEELRCLIDVVQSKKEKPVNIQGNLSNAISNIVISICTGERYDYEDEVFRKTLELLEDRFSGQSTAKRVFFIENFPILKHIPYFKESYENVLEEVKVCSEMFSHAIRHHEETFDKYDFRDVIDAYIHESRLGKQKEHFKKSFLLCLLRDLYHAGTETTTTTLRWCFLFLAQDQGLQDDIRKEIFSVLGHSCNVSTEMKTRTPLTCSFLHEMQRYRPVVPLVPRSTTQNVVFKGYCIPQNTAVLANIWQCHHDEENFKDPYKFIPRRFINEEGKFEKHDRVIPYGIGGRYCIGMHLADMEVFVFLVGMLRSFRLTEDGDNPLPDFQDKISGLVQSPLPFKLKFMRLEADCSEP